MANDRKTNKSKLNFSIRRQIVSEARRKTSNIIRREELKGNNLSRDEVNAIYRKEKSNIGRKYAFRGFIAALGLTGLITSSTKMLTASTIENESNTPNIETTLDSNTTLNNERQKFLDEIKVDEPISIDNSKEEQEENYDLVINSIVDSYNKKYDTNISIDDLKYLESTNNTYLYNNEYGDYTFDPAKNMVESPLPMTSATMYSIIDGKSNNIIFSVGSFKKGTEKEPEYKIVDTRIALLGPGKTFNNANKEGNYLHSDEIVLNNNEENISIEEKLYDACQFKLEQVLNKDKSDNELSK